MVRISDRIAYLNHDLDDSLRAGVLPEVPAEFMELGPTHAKRIGAMVQDVIEHSRGVPRVGMSDALMARMNDMKDFLFDRVYLNYPAVRPDTERAQMLVKELFAHYCQTGNLPGEFEGVQGAVDYVAGMTDRFAIETFTKLRLPAEFRALP